MKLLVRLSRHTYRLWNHPESQFRNFNQIDELFRRPCLCHQRLAGNNKHQSDNQPMKPRLAMPSFDNRT